MYVKLSVLMNLFTNNSQMKERTFIYIKRVQVKSVKAVPQKQLCVVFVLLSAKNPVFPPATERTLQLALISVSLSDERFDIDDCGRQRNRERHRLYD